MAKIRLLSENVIGKIAAGEVVERPAAAIKELVENSLDAGSKTITVDIREGGIDFFRVSDDGCGIESSDIRMAFERHATSKISGENDLNAIGTLGFRGEALASIAAVGRVTMVTRTATDETGLRVVNEGGRITAMEETAARPGTTITVRDLFYNVPVRRDFLKKPATETNAVSDLMMRLILSRPDVRFQYTSNGRTVYASAGDGKTESALLGIYGLRAVKAMRKVEGHAGGMLIRGYVGIGDNARASRAAESFFINGRMLRSPLLSGAVEDACRERVMVGKYPMCALYLEMPYESVNINVHPNKMEVRFRDDAAVRQGVFSIVFDALQDRDAFERPVEMSLTTRKEETALPEMPPAAETKRAVVEFGVKVPGVIRAEGYTRPTPVLPEGGGKETPAGAVPSGNGMPLRPRETGRELEPDLLPPVETGDTASASDRAEHNALLRTAVAAGDYRVAPVRAAEPENAVYRAAEPENAPAGETADASGRAAEPENVQAAEPVPEAGGAASVPAAEPEQLSVLPAEAPRPMKIFGAVFDTFILIEYADHLLLVDQHAAHERLLYERMMKAYESHRAGQEMLVPIIVSLTKREQALLEENREMLEGIGLVTEPFGEQEVAIRSVPMVLGNNAGEAFLREAVAELENGRTPGAERKRAEILQMACKHAVKGGEALSESDLRYLVEQMIDRKVTPTCPHGRPLVVSISHTELDKKFKRIQS